MGSFFNDSTHANYKDFDSQMEILNEFNHSRPEWQEQSSEGKDDLCVIHATLPLFPQPSVFLHQEVQVTIFRYTPAYFCTVPRFMPADFHALAIFQHPTLGKLVGAMFLRSQGCLIKGKIDIELALICATG